MPFTKLDLFLQIEDLREQLQQIHGFEHARFVKEIIERFVYNIGPDKFFTMLTELYVTNGPEVVITRTTPTNRARRISVIRAFIFTSGLINHQLTFKSMLLDDTTARLIHDEITKGNVKNITFPVEFAANLVQNNEFGCP